MKFGKSDIKDTGENAGVVQLYDIAPTILHMYGIPVPEDEKVSKGIFREGSEPERKEVEYWKVGRAIRSFNALEYELLLRLAEAGIECYYLDIIIRIK